MPTLAELARRLWDRVHRERLSRELEDELRFHRSLIERDARAAGLAEPAAARAARARLGNHTHYREESRDMWSLGAIDDWMQDLHYALRSIRATPGFSLVVTLTLALGIGSTTAIYTVVDNVLLRPLPYSAPQGLVQLLDVQETGERTPASFQEYKAWKQRSGAALSDVAAMFNNGQVLQTADGAEQLQGAAVSVNVPAMLGVHPLLGRSFRPDEEGPSAPRVVMLGEAVWRSQFHADPRLIGRTVMLTGQPYTVIGILPDAPSSHIPSAYAWSHHVPDFWLPLRLDDKASPPGLHWLNVVGRLRPGVDLAAARNRLAAMIAGIQHDLGTKHSLEAVSLTDSIMGNYRAPLRLLLAAVGLLLLIACINTANLLLARGATRQREFAVRTALGAGRRRLLRLLLVESMVRALLGGVCGVGVAFLVVRALRQWLGTTIPRLTEAAIDGRVLVACVLITVGCGIAFGLFPALRAGTLEISSDLRDGGRGATGGVSRDRVRRSLIVTEVAFSFMLLATAGLLTRSVMNLLNVSMGFDTRDVVAGYTWLPGARYPDSLSQKQFFDRVTQELGQIYRPENVTIVSDLPIEGGTSGGVDVEGRKASESPVSVEKRVVGANYFDMLHARVVAGRSLSASDVLGTPPVVVINETLAKMLFPNENPVGKRVSFDWGIDGYQTVAGVVADLREGALNAESRPAIYISAEQRPNPSMHFLVRTTAPFASVAATFRDVLRRTDPTLPLVEARTLDDVVRGTVEQPRLTMMMLAAFAAVALLLAAIGLYGVISYSVAQRTQELGVRAALGALPRDLMRLVVGQAFALSAVGIALGLAGAVAVRGLITTQLFGVGASDPITLGVAATILLGVAALASISPMRRAAGSDPLEALRAQ